VLIIVLAAGGNAGKLLDWARTDLNIVPQIVKRSDDATGFVVLPSTVGRRTRSDPGLPDISAAYATTNASNITKT
jgi:hypothetical protein